MAENKKHGGRKLNRSAKDKSYYAGQFYRTRRNKIRRLMKRLEFDPQAEIAIKLLENKTYAITAR
jgi:hypothetical protein